MINQHRKILHVDMDYFYAQVEIRDDPSLKDKYVVIAHEHHRGVICTCSYNARGLGIHSGMSVTKAKEISDKLTFVAPNMEKYKQISNQIMTIIKKYSDIIEQVALDEAYIDVTFNKLGIRDSVKIAKMIKREIYNQLHLTCSVGVSYNKFLAKIGSDYQKPNGVTVINPDNAKDLLLKLDIKKFLGIGKKTLSICYEQGIYTGADLYQKDLDQLQLIFGEKTGTRLYNQVRGIDVDNIHYEREVQSISYEKTLDEDIYFGVDVDDRLKEVSKQTSERLVAKGYGCQTITLRIRFDDFSLVTRSITLNRVIYEPEEIYKIAKELLKKIMFAGRGVRLIGIGGSKLHPIVKIKKQKHYKQILLPLFED